MGFGYAEPGELVMFAEEMQVGDIVRPEHQEHGYLVEQILFRKKHPQFDEMGEKVDELDLIHFRGIDMEHNSPTIRTFNAQLVIYVIRVRVPDFVPEGLDGNS